MFTENKVTKVNWNFDICYIQYFNFYFVSSDFRERGLYGMILPILYWGGLYYRAIYNEDEWIMWLPTLTIHKAELTMAILNKATIKHIKDTYMYTMLK